MANWEIVIEGRQGSADMLNVLHYQSSGVEPPDFAAAATVIKGHLGDHLTTYAVPAVTWVGITVREDIPGSVGTFIPFPTGTLVGTNADADAVAQVAVFVRKRSQGLIRPTLGWAFQGGITVHGTNASFNWDTAILDAVEAYWEDIRIMTIAGPTTLTMVIKARNPTAPNTQAYSPVNAVEAAVSPRVLKGRRIGAGS